MPLIDLSTIPVTTNVHTKRRRPKPRPPTVDMDATIRHLASLIDPGAFADNPPASREMLEADLTHARQVITDLYEEIEWLSAIPTDPVGEYQRIMAEKHHQERLTAPRQRQRVARHQRILDVAKRRKTAITKAKLLFEECQKVLGRRNTLIIVKGSRGTRFISRKGGL